MSISANSCSRTAVDNVASQFHALLNHFVRAVLGQSNIRVDVLPRLVHQGLRRHHPRQLGV